MELDQYFEDYFGEFGEDEEVTDEHMQHFIKSLSDDHLNEFSLATSLAALMEPDPAEREAAKLVARWCHKERHSRNI